MNFCFIIINKSSFFSIDEDNYSLQLSIWWSKLITLTNEESNIESYPYLYRSKLIFWMAYARSDAIIYDDFILILLSHSIAVSSKS